MSAWKICLCATVSGFTTFSAFDMRRLRRRCAPSCTGLLVSSTTTRWFNISLCLPGSLRLGACSLDVEVFVHLAVRDLGHFLELQGQLLLQIMEVIEAEGVRLAIPAQTAYLAITPGSDLSSVQALFDKPGPNRSQQNRDAA
jgi:hypothetical protein